MGAHAERGTRRYARGALIAMDTFLKITLAALVLLSAAHAEKMLASGKPTPEPLVTSNYPDHHQKAIEDAEVQALLPSELGNATNISAVAASDYCPLTEYETTLEKVVAKRWGQRVPMAGYPGGEIEKTIEARGGGWLGVFNNLKQDLNDVWVHNEILGQQGAIESFVIDMKKSKKTPPSGGFFNALFGWIVHIIDALSGFTLGLIKESVDILMQGVEAIKADIKADQTHYPNMDYIDAAQMFIEQLQNEALKKTFAVDKFITNLTNICSEKSLMGQTCTPEVLEAYDLGTALIGNTTSERQSYNSYYFSYLQQAVPYFDDSTNNRFPLGNRPLGFHIHVETYNPTYGPNHTTSGPAPVFWTPTPEGFEPCTLAEKVFMKMNLGCVSAHTFPRFTHNNLGSLFGLKVYVHDKIDVRNWEPIPNSGTTLLYDCKDLLAGKLDKYEGCWTLKRGTNLGSGVPTWALKGKWDVLKVKTDDPACATFSQQQVPAITVPGGRWRQDILDFCQKGFTSVYAGTTPPDKYGWPQSLAKVPYITAYNGPFVRIGSYGGIGYPECTGIQVPYDHHNPPPDCASQRRVCHIGNMMHWTLRADGTLSPDGERCLDWTTDGNNAYVSPCYNVNAIKYRHQIWTLNKQGNLLNNMALELDDQIKSGHQVYMRKPQAGKRHQVWTLSENRMLSSGGLCLKVAPEWKKYTNPPVWMDTCEES